MTMLQHLDSDLIFKVLCHVSDPLCLGRCSRVSRRMRSVARLPDLWAAALCPPATSLALFLDRCPAAAPAEYAAARQPRRRLRTCANMRRSARIIRGRRVSLLDSSLKPNSASKLLRVSERYVVTVDAASPPSSIHRAKHMKVTSL